MIKINQAIPETIPDGSNPQEMMDFLTQVKLVVEELVRKAKSIQTEVKTSAPTVADFEVEGEDVRCSANNKTYTLFNGSVKSHAET